jgi:peptide/nickel transport system substrate-binding protein
MTMKRRAFLQATTAAALMPLAAPRLGGAAEARLLKFIPQADLAILDPI